MSEQSGQLHAAVFATVALAEAIRDLGSVPSGHLYARIMDRVDLASYQAMITALKRAGLVRETNHLLEWIGPTS